MFNVHAIREPKTDARGCNVFSAARILFLVVAVDDRPASTGCQGCNVFFEALLGRKESQAMGKQGVHIYFQRLPSLGYQGQLSSCVCNIRGVNRVTGEVHNEHINWKRTQVTYNNTTTILSTQQKHINLKRTKVTGFEHREFRSKSEENQRKTGYLFFQQIDS